MTNTPTPLPQNNNSRYFWPLIIGAILLFLWLVKAVLLPFVVGILVAYFLDPAADKLEKWGLSRLSATLVITISFFVTLTSAVIVLMPVLFDQLAILIHEMPTYISAIQETMRPKISAILQNFDQNGIEGAQDALKNVSGEISVILSDILSKILRSGAAVMNLVSLLLITPIVAFYLLRDWDTMIEHMHSLLPRQHADTIITQLGNIDDTLAGFVRGQLNVCFLLGSFYALSLTLAGLKLGMAIGFIAGVAIILPYIGAALSAILALTVAYLQFDGDATHMAIIAGIFIIGQVMEGGIITPRLVGEKVGLHPVWLIFGMLSGGALFGFVGILIAVPTTAVIGVMIRFTVSRYLESDHYDNHSTQATNQPPSSPKLS